MNPAEVAQARLFEAALQAEFAELHRIASTIAERRNRTPESNTVTPQQPREMTRINVRINARINEVHRLLEALRDRFPSVRSGERAVANAGLHINQANL
ncbi:hypothetical protein AWC26_20155 [Mycobacterium shimoidei]|nr:hypothetical protein BHQ16_18125 [Mycobacterium shimoidei]ORW76791.1 hypothetical protein AWC26_20155 [Mycobacterium shimoidei]